MRVISDKVLRDYFSTIDLDIRKSNNARFFDQKVQPDVLSGVCESMLFCLEDSAQEFTTGHIRDCSYSEQIVTSFFNKPSIAKAPNEYDKFFGQPLKTLAYARVLEERKKSNKNHYKIREKELIEYIALSDRNAYRFLALYLEKVVQDSGIWEWFEEFFELQTQESLERLRENFIDFMIRFTPINGRLEPIRILNPLLNILSFKYKKRGTKAGKVAPIYYNDLLYNRPNWRDLKKDKSLTREEFARVFQNTIHNLKYYKYSVQKAKRYVKNLHPYSEIHRFGAYRATQAHHIFPSCEYPEIADLPENIIALTPNQHFCKAHPNNKTSLIDPAYQAICLLAKLDSIEYDRRNNLGNYSWENFVKVVNVGLDKEFAQDIDFEEMKYQIAKHYFG